MFYRPSRCNRRFVYSMLDRVETMFPPEDYPLLMRLCSWYARRSMPPPAALRQGIETCHSSRITRIERALRQLEREGFAERKPNGGWRPVGPLPRKHSAAREA